MSDGKQSTSECQSTEREAEESPSSAIQEEQFLEPEIDSAVQLPLLQMGFSLTQGPIPSPDVMREYEHIDKAINRAILDDFQRRSLESVKESEHRRWLEVRFVQLEAKEQELRIAESRHSQDVGSRSSHFTPWYIFGSLAFLVIISLLSPMEGWALASVLSAAMLAGAVIIAVAILRGPVGSEEGKTISSVAGSVSRRQIGTTKPDTDQELPKE